MAVPGGIPVEQSICEIDAEIRMEDIRQSPAARLKMEHFYGAIKRSLMNKGVNYEADHRKEILEGLKYMKRHLPADAGASLVKKLENLSLNLGCLHENENDTFLMKSEDLTLTVKHKHEKALSSEVSYFGTRVPHDDEITNRINDGAWEELRNLIQFMLGTVPSHAPKDVKMKLARYRLNLEQSLRSRWSGGDVASILDVNTSPVGFPSRPTSVRPQRLFIYGEPGMEIELREKGSEVIDVEKGEVPFAQIVIVDYNENCVNIDGQNIPYAAVVKLELSARWIISSQIMEQLKKLGAKPCSIFQKTNIVRLIANSTLQKNNVELVGHELGRDVRYLVKEEWINEEMDAIVDGFYMERPEKMEEMLTLLHQQAVFNSSWESIVASCCHQYSASRNVRFEMIPRGFNWEIIFCGQDCLYNLRLHPITGTRHWSIKLSSSHKSDLSELSHEIEKAFNRTWSLSKCLAHLITRLDIVGLESTIDESMDTSLPYSDCSLSYCSKVGQAWLRKEVIAPPPPPKHELQVDLPKGRCPLLRMMREKPVRKPFKVARPRPQLSNPTVPPLRVNRMELQAGLPIQSHPATPFNNIEKMVKSVEEGSRSVCPPSGPPPMDASSLYGHSGYSPLPSHRIHAALASGASPLARPAMPPAMSPYPPQPHPDLMRQQQQQQHQFMRQQSTTSLTNSGVFDFQDDSGSSPSSVQDLSPAAYSYGYGSSQSPLVRGGGTTKARRARGRKAGNVGDRTPASSIDSPSHSAFSPEGPKRPKSGPGSRGGRGSRGKRGITMDQVVSPFQRSLSELSNTMSSPLASATPAYSTHSFDEGTSDDECDPPPFSRASQSSSMTPSVAVPPSPLSTTTTPSSMNTPPIPLSHPPSQPSTPLISVVPSPLVPSSSTTPSLSSLVQTLSSMNQPPPSSSTSSPYPLPSSSSSIPSLSSSSLLHPIVRRKSSIESVVGQPSATQAKKTSTSDIFDTGLESSPPASPPPSMHTHIAPILIPETKTESPRKEGEERVVLKLTKKSTKEVKKKEKEKEKDREKKRDDKNTKSGEEKDRKRKAESSKEKKEKEAKKPKMEQPLIGAVVTMRGALKGFKIPKTGAKGGGWNEPSSLSMPSSSSLPPPLTSPSLTKPPSSYTSQMGGPPPFRGTQIKTGPSGTARPQMGGNGGGRATKSILKSSGAPIPSGSSSLPGPHGMQGRNYPPERKMSHPPIYSDPTRTRHPSGGNAYPPPSHPSSLHPSSMPQVRRGGPLPPKGTPQSQSWVHIQQRMAGGMEGIPTLTPNSIPGPAHLSRMDAPPTLESNVPASRSIIDDSPASPDGLQIVDD